MTGGNLMTGQNNQHINVFIVEDEIAVRRSLIGKIPWGYLGMNLMGQAQNAEEAYEAIRLERPDIILLDMRMPGMGGMAFLEILKRQFPAIEVIVLSGYSDFEYVKQALRCGATDYLLKPIIKEELEKALIQAMDNIKADRQKKQERMQQNLLLNQSIPYFKRNLLNTLVRGVYMDCSELLKKLALLHVKLTYPHYLLAMINIIDFEQIKRYYRSDVSLVFFALENVMTESTGYAQRFIGFKSELRENEYICLLGFEEKENIRHQVQEIFRKTILNIEKYNKWHIHISVSQAFSEITEVHQIYKQLSYVWHEQQDGKASRLLFYEDLQPEAADAESSLWSSEAALEWGELMAKRDWKGLTRAIHHLFLQLKSRYNDDLRMYKKAAARIYRMMEEKVQQMPLRSHGQAAPDHPAFNEWVSKYTNIDDLKYGLIALLNDADSPKNKNGQTKKLIEQAKEYIDHYFYEDLSLDFMAQKFYMNRTYFSELFKQETGCSFKKYLIQVRIDKAKELLAGQKMKAVNVALLVGFKDPVYFSTVFKKSTGLSFKEYADQI